MLYLEGDPPDTRSPGPGPVVWLPFDPDPHQDRLESLAPNSVALTFTLPDSSTVLPEFAVALGDVARRLSSPYAFGFVSAQSLERNCELEAIEFVYSHEYDEHGREPPERVVNNKRLTALSLQRHRLGRDVRGPYWANYWSADIVARIGGVNAFAGVSAATLHPYDDGAVALQLTDVPRAANGPDLGPLLDALGKVLAPVTVPHSLQAVR